MAVVGDLVAYLSMDSSRFAQGAQQAQVVAVQTNAAMTKAFSPQVFQQAGFALQDFMSILQMGGANAAARAFGGVANNVQMLGAAFGPMGMAVTSVGGALAGILIPALLRSEEATNTLTQRTQDLQTALNARLDALQAAHDREMKLNDLAREGNAQRIARERDNAVTEARLIEERLRIRQEAYRDALLRENVLAQEAGGQVARAFVEEAGRRREVPLASAFGPSGEVREGFTVSVEEKTFNALRTQKDEIDKLKAARRENLALAEALQGVEGNNAAAMAALGPEERLARVRQQQADAQRRQLENDNKAFAEGIKQREEMWNKTRTPAERYRMEVQKIADQFKRGIIDEESATRALAQLQPQGEQIRTTQGALTQGSAAAISAITQAVGAKDAQAQQLQIAKQQLEAAQELLRSMTRVEEKLDLQPVEVPQ
jgi:hypothetical protein